MTPELIAAIIACLGALAGWLKSHSEVSSVRAERQETKAQRDRDSMDLHDQVLKNSFEVANMKGRIDLHDEKLDDINKQTLLLTKQLAEVCVKLDVVNENMKEIKER